MAKKYCYPVFEDTGLVEVEYDKLKTIFLDKKSAFDFVDKKKDPNLYVEKWELE